VPAGHAHEATLAFEYERTERAELVASSVAVEQGQIADDRSAATVDRDGDTVRVRVTAADLVALRAGCNTWLGLVDTAESLARVGRERAD
jgi:KEOPS complex subunit Pcc1